LAAVLSECNGAKDKNPNTVGAAEHRRYFESQRAAVSSWICQPQAQQILRVRRALKIPRSGGNPRSGQAAGSAFLLDTFLWRSKEKYLALQGETLTPGKSRKSVLEFKLT